MTGFRAKAVILAEHLQVTLALTEANAIHHRAQAKACGSEIELMAHANAEGGASEEQAAAAERDVLAQADLARAESTVAELQERLRALDGELAAAEENQC